MSKPLDGCTQNVVDTLRLIPHDLDAQPTREPGDSGPGVISRTELRLLQTRILV